ncbi:MAG TPA: dihydrolipoamide acetyltransferase family protein [Paludibacteraceae bacterium]|nr:dihydrolipoamide acetyltransferase family protein [Paludibacteraceae bacterium]HON02524.1 dihydrolipoamide acetyltransferase family protein [Paludibacteraceae bacterium]HPD59157.1 dihydrolipoamide acetyltransferase family protein [Paludibacteraceae bacterium]HPQ12529.1 dihydrolipoamide acetyltransferase family protein [Paludibacteraceae bacterium]HRT78399.1 dihydrolipoamide acetyltransferase family protein [Paludibacteraceae bacterium]
MAVVVIMPKQGQSVESCIVTEIKKKKGDTVKKGDILFSYETDKASFEEESPVDGVILECFHEEGDEVPVLQNVMIIGEPGENYSDLLAQTNISESVKEEPEIKTRQSVAEVESSPAQPALAEPQSKNNAPISPRAKYLAEKEAIETSALTGSGPNGRIIEKDVRAALENRPKLTPLAKKLASEEGLQPTTSGSGLNGIAKSVDLSAPTNAVYGLDYEDRKLPNIRKLIAKSMQASLQNSAQLTHHLGADARCILQLRKKAKAAYESGQLQVNITLNDFVCFAVIKALQKFPNVNSHFLGDSIRYFKKIHLGLAVDTDRGLMVPVVRNADDLSIIGLASQLKEVAALCRKGNVNPEILSSEAGTFTVSNLGNYGVEIFTPIINLPQSAILGVNTIVPRPKDLGDGVYGFLPYIGLSLTYDHRSIDGGEATRFLKQIAVEIENLEIELF